MATALLSDQRYYIAVEITLVITALGVLSCLLRALFSPRQRKVVIVERVGSDRITVTRAAISAQATHIVEHGGAYAVERVWVRARKHSVSVALRVRPSRPIDVTQEGIRLHDELVAGLSSLVGDAISGVELEFVEAAMQSGGGYGSVSDDASLGGSTLAALADESRNASTPVLDAPTPSEFEQLTASTNGEITVPIGHVMADAAVQGDGAGEQE